MLLVDSQSWLLLATTSQHAARENVSWFSQLLVVSGVVYVVLDAI